jgi:hypothetical protein
MRFGSDQDWLNLYNIAIKTSDNSERLRMLGGLATTQNYNLLKL